MFSRGNVVAFKEDQVDPIATVENSYSRQPEEYNLPIRVPSLTWMFCIPLDRGWHPHCPIEHSLVSGTVRRLRFLVSMLPNRSSEVG